ncbi:MAG: trypsin-like peptidase domain-containing protein, partial [Magnetococcales bacterium]|nr:trypsin-like peptidase domain-containing protein [Magnetococcales bacterium]
GSGFFLGPTIIATVAHQVEGARTVDVHLPDGTFSSGRVMASAPNIDVALVQVPETDRVGLALYSKALADLGEEVFTIGCPMALAHTLSRGVISSPKRTIDGMDFIQTDLVVNGGNSGGPLLNNDGQVLGLIKGTWQDVQGLNFAIPSHYVVGVLDAFNKGAGGAMGMEKLLALAAQEKDAKRRLTSYQIICDRYPDAPEPLFYKAATLRMMGRHTQAKETLIQTIQVKYDYARAYLLLGDLYSNHLRKPRSAKQAYKRYLALKPQSRQAARVKKWLAKQ